MPFSYIQPPYIPTVYEMSTICMMLNCTRRVVLENAFNLRDLGGYAIPNGQMTRFHLLYRSDSLYNLSESDWEILRERGIRTILDLRSETEQEQQPYDSARYGIMHCPASLLSKAQSASVLQKAFPIDIEKSYLNLLRNNAKGLHDALCTIIASLSDGAVLFHCTAGKDRTGVIAALLLHLCGVADEDIVADYQISATYNQKLAGQNPLFMNASEEMKNSRPENMVSVLSYLHGMGDAFYTEHLGLEEGTIRQFLLAFLQ